MTRKNENDTSRAREAAPAQANDDVTVVRLDRVRDRLEIKRQDAEADALAARFHTAMGWKGRAKNNAGGKSKRKKRT